MNRIVNESIDLVPYYPNETVTLSWYQDLQLVKQVDNIDQVYTLDRLQAMYNYLSSHGDCFYIEYQGYLVGDITLLADGEIAIVICKDYQNRHIGRLCVENMMALAREKGMKQVKARIYDFNHQSQHMFQSLGFRYKGDEWYIHEL